MLQAFVKRSLPLILVGAALSFIPFLSDSSLRTPPELDAFFASNEYEIIQILTLGILIPIVLKTSCDILYNYFLRKGESFNLLLFFTRILLLLAFFLHPFFYMLPPISFYDQSSKVTVCVGYYRKFLFNCTLTLCFIGLYSNVPQIYRYALLFLVVLVVFQTALMLSLIFSINSAANLLLAFDGAIICGIILFFSNQSIRLYKKIEESNAVAVISIENMSYIFITLVLTAHYITRVVMSASTNVASAYSGIAVGVNRTLLYLDISALIVLALLDSLLPYYSSYRSKYVIAHELSRLTPENTNVNGSTDFEPQLFYAEIYNQFYSVLASHDVVEAHLVTPLVETHCAAVTASASSAVFPHQLAVTNERSNSEPTFQLLGMGDDTHVIEFIPSLQMDNAIQVRGNSSSLYSLLLEPAVRLKKCSSGNNFSHSCPENWTRSQDAEQGDLEDELINAFRDNVAPSFHEQDYGRNISLAILEPTPNFTSFSVSDHLVENEPYVSAKAENQQQVPVDWKRVNTLSRCYSKCSNSDNISLVSAATVEGRHIDLKFNIQSCESIKYQCELGTQVDCNLNNPCAANTTSSRTDSFRGSNVSLATYDATESSVPTEKGFQVIGLVLNSTTNSSAKSQAHRRRNKDTMRSSVSESSSTNYQPTLLKQNYRRSFDEPFSYHSEAYIQSLHRSSCTEFRSVSYPGRPPIEDLLLSATFYGSYNLACAYLLEQVKIDTEAHMTVLTICFNSLTPLKQGRLNIRDMIRLVETSSALQQKLQGTLRTCLSYFHKVDREMQINLQKPNYM